MAIGTQIEKLDPERLRYEDGQTVVGQLDIPGLGAREMQMAVESLPRNVLIPLINVLVDAVNKSYSKEEADRAMGERIVAVGAADMAKAVYDPSGAVERAGGIAAYAMPKNGGAMTGSLQLSADPTTAMQAATKQYVDSKVKAYCDAAITEAMRNVLKVSSFSGTTLNTTST